MKESLSAVPEKKPHMLCLHDRQSLSVSGVRDVDSFDEETVVMYTDLGELTVKGVGLHIHRLNIESGDVSVEGKVDSLYYTEPRMQGGFFGKLFR
jgi:sporulation protein YabP